MTQENDRVISLRLLKKAFDNIPRGIAKVNREQKITYANRQMCEMLGTNTLNGIDIKKLFPDEKNYSIIDKQLNNRFTNQLASEYEVELTRFDGSKIPISIIAIPDTDQQEETVESFAIAKSLLLEKVIETIHHNVENSCDGKEILRCMAQEVYRVVPFDALRVILYSLDGNNYQSLFSYSRGGKQNHEYVGGQ